MSMDKFQLTDELLQHLRMSHFDGISQTLPKLNRELAGVAIVFVTTNYTEVGVFYAIVIHCKDKDDSRIPLRLRHAADEIRCEGRLTKSRTERIA